MAERAFGIDELFFSTTDAKGVIRSGNRVFSRVAGYAQDELIGRPHNVVRHPDMPRAVFELFWDTIAAGKPIAAYVKNRAADGSPYWVLATALPIPDGYLSIRLKPSTPYFDTVRSIYEQVRALEVEVEGPRGRDRKRAIEVGTELLGELVAGAGFAGYDDLMRTLLPAELAARDAALAALPPEPTHAGGDDWRDGLLDLLDSVRHVHAFLDREFGSLAGYVELNRLIADRSSFLLELAADIRLFSLNALLAAARLGSAGRTLAVVAELMRGSSTGAGDGIRALSAEIDETVALLHANAFRISLGKLEAEIMSFFVDELLEHADDIGDAERGRIEDDLRTLSAVLHRMAAEVLDATDEEHARLASLGRRGADVARDLKLLHVLEVNGRIEAASAGDTETVSALFAEIASQLGGAREQLGVFASLERAGRGDADHDRRLLAAPLQRLAG